MFAKLRREAKKAAKKPTGAAIPENEIATMKDIPEIEPLSKEELETLLVAAVAVEKPGEVEVYQAEEQAIAAEVSQNKTFEAMGVFYNAKIKKFCRVLIDYDPETGAARVSSITDLADSSAVAASRVGQYYSLKLIRRTEVLD